MDKHCKQHPQVHIKESAVNACECCTQVPNWAGFVPDLNLFHYGGENLPVAYYD